MLAGAATLLADVAEQAPRHVYAAASEGVRFEPAILGSEAGLLGAALYAASSIVSREELFTLSSRAAASLGARRGRGRMRSASR